MSPLLRFLALILLIASNPVFSDQKVDVPSCGEVVNVLTSCLGFLNGKEATPQCCAGLKKLQSEFKTKNDHVAVCNYGKEALSHMTYDPKRIPLLPKQCGMDMSLPPIDKNYDCSKVPVEGGQCIAT